MSKAKSQEKHDYLVKLVIIGNSAVGKTNILLRYATDKYRASHVSTIGVDFKVKTVEVEGVRIKMHIWDTAGQERFRTITETYYKGAVGVILAYSVTDRKSFQDLENWIQQIHETNPSICKLVVGNKIDGEKEREVSHAEGLELARRYNTNFVECSAKENINIGEIFSTIGKSIKDKLVGSPVQPSGTIPIGKVEKNKKVCGC